MIHDHESRKFTEQDFYIGQDYRANVYIRTKFEAENLILKALDNGLNATIFRVGVLTGRYSDGQFQTNIGQNAFYRQLKAILMLEAIPYDFLQEHLEFSPVDYCAKAIVQLTQSKNTSMPVFHVFNHNTINAGEMLQFFEALGVRIKPVSQKSFDSLLVSISTTNFGKEILSGIISNLNINDTIGFVSNIQVESSQTIKHLSNIGFEWPDIHGDYILKVLKHMQVTGFFQKVL
jgi:thioester reductase-like protein